MKGHKVQVQRPDLHSVSRWETLKVLNRGVIRAKTAGGRETREWGQLLQTVGQGELLSTETQLHFEHLSAECLSSSLLSL